MATVWKKLADIGPNDVTPMLRQYIQAKSESGDSILFFRMGDFYELFFEDAVEASELIGLTLTSRDSSGSEARIPMAGVPVRAVDGYIAKLIKAGRTVTICEQLEDPKQVKGIVKRDIVRTVTPGTVLEPDLLDESRNNYLAALSLSNGHAGLAFVDVSTGEFLAAQIESHIDRTVHDEFVRMRPSEILVPDDMDEAALDALKTRFDGVAFTRRPADDFAPDLARERLLERFGLGTLKGVALDDAPAALGCAGAAAAYVGVTQRDTAPRLRLPRRYSPSGYVVLDGATQRNLELVESLADKRKRGSLLGVLDKTLTSMGGRKLRQWILHPLLDPAVIAQRHSAIEELVYNGELRMEMRDLLKAVADLERLLGRLTARTGNARDLRALGRSLEGAPRIKAALATCQSGLLAELHRAIDELTDVAGLIAERVVDEPPLTILEGGILKSGWHDELDRLTALVRGGRDWIATLQKDESARTGIPNLKVGYNKVFGYYIEISKSYTKQAPADYERKQTLVNAERYITPTLKEREEEIVGAQDKMQRLEYDLFCELRDAAARESARIQETAEAIATVDVLLSLAEVAVSKNYARPEVDDSDVLIIRDGRHPVVEDLMTRSDFVPNDTAMDPASSAMQIITGPNMAGKSTYLRQVALITLMAQIGSFVPAASARIGVVDRIFTRVGASDNLVRGESTFMVEMIETANILNMATPRSLLVLDEIGRGTSTFDGISIAWSVAEHIHDGIGAKTLFATHYHELTELGTRLVRAKNLNVAVREWSGKVVFLYRIVDGGADHSYGIQVAKLAGLPEAVIKRAREVLDMLESGDTSALGIPQQMSLFGGGGAPEPTPGAVERELSVVDIDGLTPRQAHDFLYHLRETMRKDAKR